MTAIVEPYRTQLLASIKNKKWLALSVSDLDIGYSLLTTEQKQGMIDSLRATDSNARILINGILNSMIDQYAEQVLSGYEAAGAIPVADIENLL